MIFSLGHLLTTDVVVFSSQCHSVYCKQSFIRERFIFANIKRREYVYNMPFIHKIRCQDMAVVNMKRRESVPV